VNSTLIRPKRIYKGNQPETRMHRKCNVLMQQLILLVISFYRDFYTKMKGHVQNIHVRPELRKKRTAEKAQDP